MITYVRRCICFYIWICNVFIILQDENSYMNMFTALTMHSWSSKSSPGCVTFLKFTHALLMKNILCKNLVVYRSKAPPFQGSVHPSESCKRQVKGTFGNQPVPHPTSSSQSLIITSTRLGYLQLCPAESWTLLEKKFCSSSTQHHTYLSGPFFLPSTVTLSSCNLWLLPLAILSTTATISTNPALQVTGCLWVTLYLALPSTKQIHLLQ